MRGAHPDLELHLRREIGRGAMGTTGVAALFLRNVLHVANVGDSRAYLVREGIHFAWELHDGLYFYVPVAKAERAQTEIKTLLDNLPYKKAWGFSPPIPLPWDCKVGSSWGQLKEVKF